jgi:hypothetical protein
VKERVIGFYEINILIFDTYGSNPIVNSVHILNEFKGPLEELKLGKTAENIDVRSDPFGKR